MKKLLLFPLLLMVFSFTAHATHLQGGFIRYQHLDGRTYSVVLTIYTSPASPVVFGENGVLDFGDGSSVVLSSSGEMSRLKTTRINEDASKNVITFEHTYPSNGSYTISYSESFRNEGVLNMENSVNIPFYIESFLLVDPLLHNNSVRLKDDPPFVAYQNQTYHYNPEATDPDGDSISYHSAVALQGHQTAVEGFTYPHLTFDPENRSETGENAYFTINPYTGDLIWDAPVKTGEYVLSLEIREWRRVEGELVMTGNVLQEFLVHVTDPVDELQLIFPVTTQKVSLDAHTPWEKTITAIADNPEDTVVLELLGDFLMLSPELNPADSTAAKGEVSATIRYQPSETENKPYQLIAKAYIYSATGESGYPKTRSVYLVPHGVINGISDLPVKKIRVYPNPSFSNSFSLDYPVKSGKEVVLSLFGQDGRLAYQTTIPSWSAGQAVQLPQPLSGYYLIVIRQGNKLYTSAILFSQK